MDALTDNIGRVRSRIVQSPDRIKRSIITMGSTAAEDKKTVSMNETKIRDLQAKINALLNIEKVRICAYVLNIYKRYCLTGWYLVGCPLMCRRLAKYRERSSCIGRA